MNHNMASGGFPMQMLEHIGSNCRPFQNCGCSLKHVCRSHRKS